MRSAFQRPAGDCASVGPDTGSFIIPDNPYHADLPYDIKQKALFGEASYDFGQFKLTGGGRYYNFNEERDFISGGQFLRPFHLVSATRRARTASRRA